MVMVAVVVVVAVRAGRLLHRHIESSDSHHPVAGSVGRIGINGHADGTVTSAGAGAGIQLNPSDRPRAVHVQDVPVVRRMDLNVFVAGAEICSSEKSI